MKEGTDYHITIDPRAEDALQWSVIMGGPWDRVVGRYRDIEITDKGTKLNFAFEPQYVPEGTDIQCTEFDFYASEVLNGIIKNHHEKKARVYMTEDGKKVDY